MVISERSIKKGDDTIFFTNELGKSVCSWIDDTVFKILKEFGYDDGSKRGKFATIFRIFLVDFSKELVNLLKLDIFFSKNQVPRGAEVQEENPFTFYYLSLIAGRSEPDIKKMLYPARKIVKTVLEGSTLLFPFYGGLLSKKRVFASYSAYIEEIVREFSKKRRVFYINKKFNLRNLKNRIPLEVEFLFSESEEAFDDFLKVLLNHYKTPSYPFIKAVKLAFFYFFKKAKALYFYYRTLFKFLKPLFFITWNDHFSHDRAMLEVSFEENVPSFYVQHGFIMEKNLLFPLNKCVFFAWGKGFVEMYHEKGEHPRYEITGAHRLSSIFNFKPKKDPRAEFGIKNKKVILFATQWISRFSSFHTGEEVVEVARVLKGILKSNPSYFLIVKLHQGKEETFSKYEEIFRGCKNFVILKNYPIHELIYASDVVVHFSSTVGLETVIMNRPLVTANFSLRETLFPATEVPQLVVKKEELEEVIKRALKEGTYTPSERKRFIEKYAFFDEKEDSKSKIINFIEKKYAC